MPDGVVLAATLYMPTHLRAGQRLPALLEYLPYRKDDDTLPGDYGKYAYFARHGYVGARVDIRGFGNSGGTPPTREYSAQEQRDGEQVIAWLARQPWSNGNVGMLGISWGGFNSIQMAMRRPPALKAILAIAATEALFKEDVHYMDGLMHVDEFEVAMDLDQGRSGGPGFVIDEDTLARRMDSSPGRSIISGISATAPSGANPFAVSRTFAFPVFSSAACRTAIETVFRACSSMCRPRCMPGSARGTTTIRTPACTVPKWSGAIRPCAGSITG
jgi:pimeloyl-ACP methyl ester carboxylesterase